MISLKSYILEVMHVHVNTYSSLSVQHGKSEERLEIFIKNVICISNG